MSLLAGIINSSLLVLVAAASLWVKKDAKYNALKNRVLTV
jgi:hypothetical protein